MTDILCPNFHPLSTKASGYCNRTLLSAQVTSKLLKHGVSRVIERNQLVLTCVRRKKEPPNPRESNSLSNPSWYFIVKAATLRPFVFLVTATYGELVECYWKWRTEILGKEPVPVPIIPLLISNVLNWDRTRASAGRRRQIKAWALVGLRRETYVGLYEHLDLTHKEY